MSVFNPEKTVVPGTIRCSGCATVTLSFEAAASLSAEPADIILIMDRSCSMACPRLEYAQTAAKQFIDIICRASGNQNGTAIENGSRLGIVSFSETPRKDVLLTNQISVLKNAIDALQSGGSTNHEAAFLAAEQMLPKKGTLRQVVIMFTDGISTAGGDANIIAQRMKAAGVEIYCIGLGQNRTQLDRWASPPVETHVTSDADPVQLERMFRKIAEEVVLAGAHDVTIREKVNPDFRIVRIEAPTDGSVIKTDEHSIVWTIGTVGLTQRPQKVSLSFDIMHTGTAGGIKKVNHSLTYTDRAGNTLNFPNPDLEIQCSGGGIEIIPEPCPVPIGFTVENCQDAHHVEGYHTVLQCLGRIVQVDATIKNVCPGKRVAVSVILTETAPDGTNLPRGIKHILIPAQTGKICRDITLKCIPFSLPESLDATGCPDTICNPRNFNVQVIANYADTDFVCCEVRN